MDDKYALQNRPDTFGMWVSLTIGTAGVTSLFTALMNFPGAVLSFLMCGIGFGAYVWKWNKWAALTTNIVTILFILLWDYIATSNNSEPILWFLH